MARESGTPAARDSFLEILHSDIVAGTEKLSAWISRVQEAGGLEVLFELETWLRGLEAFFDPANLALSESERASAVTRSFAAELRIAGEVMRLCERHALELTSLGQVPQVEFESFLETQMRKERILDYHVGKILEQPTPHDSLHRLLESLGDLGVIVDSLGDPGRQDLRLFLSIGRSFQRALRGCRYIDMLLAQRFRLQYDRVDDPVLGGLVRSIPEAANRRNVAQALLYLYRFLKYLRIVTNDLAADRPLRHHLVLFSLLHREMRRFAELMRSRFVKGRRAGPQLRNAGGLIAHSLRMDAQRVLERELAFVANDNDASAIYAKIENSHGILHHCFQSCIITLVQAIDPSIEGKALFPSMVEGLQKAQRLRQDLWDLRQSLKDALEGKEEFDVSRLMERLAVFRETSLRHLMYRDWGEFERFADAVISAGNEVEARAQLRGFINYLDLLVLEVSKRSVLREATDKESANSPLAELSVE